MAKTETPFSCVVGEKTPQGWRLDCQSAGSLLVAEKFLPSGLEVEDELALDFKTLAQHASSQEELARAILNELLKG